MAGHGAFLPWELNFSVGKKTKKPSQTILNQRFEAKPSPDPLRVISRCFGWWIRWGNGVSPPEIFLPPPPPQICCELLFIGGEGGDVGEICAKAGGAERTPSLPGTPSAVIFGGLLGMGWGG